MSTLRDLITEGRDLLNERVRVSALSSLHEPNKEHHRSLVTLHKGKSARHYVLSTVRTSDKGPESMAFRSNSKGAYLSKLWGVDPLQVVAFITPQETTERASKICTIAPWRTSPTR